MDTTSMEVDELFGDGGTTGDTVPLNLPLEGISTEGLSRFVDDLHRTSSERKKVAWSSSGCVAAIAPDLHSVCIRYLVLSSSQRKWQLGKEHIVDLAVNGDTQHPLLQLEWSASGHEIAVADRAGRLTVINVSNMALNETTILRPAALDHEDESNQALTLQWLNIDPREVDYPKHAIKYDERWSYKKIRRRPIGPFWPRAVLAVTRRGALVAHYQRPTDLRWTIARVELRTVTSSDSLLTHAAIGCVQENKLLIAVQNSSRQISVYLATLDVPDPRDERQVATGIRVSVENIKASLPYQGRKDSGNQDVATLPFEITSHFLSHLQVVPTADIEKAEQLPPTILAFFTPFVNTMGMMNDGQPGLTIVKRWHVVSAEPKLHLTFNSMQSAGNSNRVGPITALQRLDDVRVHQIVTSVQKIEGAEQYALGSADGSLTLYDSASLTPSYAAPGFSPIHSLSQGGFVFPSLPGGLDLSISANSCVSASLTNDAKLQLTHLEQAGGLTFDLSDPLVVEAAIVAIILSFSRSVHSQKSANDILYFVTGHLGFPHHQQLLQSMFKDLFFDQDFLPNPDFTKRSAEPTVGRVLSLAASWGHDLSADQRTRASMLSWLGLHIRSCTATFLRILCSINQNRGVDWKDADACDIACNNIRWTLDLFKFIVDELFEMDDQRVGVSDPEQIPHASADTGSITQLLLLSLWPRSWLKMIPRILRGIVRATQGPKPTLSPEAAPAFSRMAELVETSSLKIEPVEQLLAGAEKVVLQSYQVSGMSVQDRADAERFILCRGEIPTVVRDAVPKILQEVLPTQRAEMDRLSLYLNDYSWLGIRDDGKTKAFKRDHVVDVHRKIIVSKKGLGRVRKCVRCGSISTDLVRVKYWPQYLQMLMSRCVCEDAFEVVGPGEIWLDNETR